MRPIYEIIEFFCDMSNSVKVFISHIENSRNAQARTNTGQTVGALYSACLRPTDSLRLDSHRPEMYTVSVLMCEVRLSSNTPKGPYLAEVPICTNLEMIS